MQDIRTEEDERAWHINIAVSGKNGWIPDKIGRVYSDGDGTSIRILKRGGKYWVEVGPSQDPSELPRDFHKGTVAYFLSLPSGCRSTDSYALASRAARNFMEDNPRPHCRRSYNLYLEGVKPELLDEIWNNYEENQRRVRNGVREIKSDIFDPESSFVALKSLAIEEMMARLPGSRVVELNGYSFERASNGRSHIFKGDTWMFTGTAYEVTKWLQKTGGYGPEPIIRRYNELKCITFESPTTPEDVLREQPEYFAAKLELKTAKLAYEKALHHRKLYEKIPPSEGSAELYESLRNEEKTAHQRICQCQAALNRLFGDPVLKKRATAKAKEHNEKIESAKVELEDIKPTYELAVRAKQKELRKQRAKTLSMSR